MRSATGRKTSLAISSTASRGVKCSPASSLFSSLKRRMSSSKIEPMPWLSRPGCLTEPSPFITGSGPRLMSGEVSFSISVPRASAFDSFGIWLRNSKLSRMSWTFPEKPSRYASKSARSRWRLARARRSRIVYFDVL